MTETGNSFHAISSRCQTSLTVLAGEGQRQVSQQPMPNPVYSMSGKSRGVHVQAKTAIEFCVYGGRSDHGK